MATGSSAASAGSTCTAGRRPRGTAPASTAGGRAAAARSGTASSASPTSRCRAGRRSRCATTATACASRSSTAGPTRARASTTSRRRPPGSCTSTGTAPSSPRAEPRSTPRAGLVEAPLQRAPARAGVLDDAHVDAVLLGARRLRLDRGQRLRRAVGGAEDQDVDVRAPAIGGVAPVGSHADELRLAGVEQLALGLRGGEPVVIGGLAEAVRHRRLPVEVARQYAAARLAQALVEGVVDPVEPVLVELGGDARPRLGRGVTAARAEREAGGDQQRRQAHAPHTPPAATELSRPRRRFDGWPRSA